MTAIPITLDLDSGRFVGTENNAGTLKMCPTYLAPTYPLDPYWQPNAGSGWTPFGGDKVVVDNTDASNLFLNLIYPINQSEAKPVTFRLLVEGENIASSGTGFSIELVLTDAGGLGGTILGDQQVNFPAGSWSERQFVVTVNPSAPAHYLYAYIFTRNIVGKVTMRTAEVFQEGDTARKHGAWRSEIYDLAQMAAEPITVGQIPQRAIAFYYNNLTNVDDMGSVDYSIEQFKKYEIVVTNPPSENSTDRQKLVQVALVDAGIKVFGYVQAGPLPSEELMTLEEIAVGIDDCAAGGYYGVFFDMFGSDYGLSRAFQNELIDYAHSKGLKVFANAWVPASVIDPAGGPVSLAEDDWVLLESYYIRGGDQYAGVPEGGFINAFKKYVQTITLAKPVGIKVCGMAYAFSTAPITDTTDFINAYILTAGLGIDSLCYNYSVEATSLDWLVSDVAVPNTGSILLSPLKQVDAETYEAKTDAGILQFIARDSPVYRGQRTFIMPPSIQVSLESEPVIDAQLHEIAYYSSPDKINWRKTGTLVTDRYLIVDLILRD